LANYSGCILDRYLRMYEDKLRNSMGRTRKRPSRWALSRRSVKPAGRRRTLARALFFSGSRRSQWVCRRWRKLGLPKRERPYRRVVQYCFLHQEADWFLRPSQAVRITGSLSVTTIVCSNCATILPSGVLSVQPFPSSRTYSAPVETKVSTANTSPEFKI
jgi:hypothetical protein